MVVRILVEGSVQVLGELEKGLCKAEFEVVKNLLLVTRSH
jgi:hypothetical protein